MARQRAHRGRSKEKGSAIIEAAFVAPVFFLLIFGIFEFGFLLRNALTVGNATSDAARTASVHGDSADADYLILRSLEHTLEPVGLDALDFVVIYRATGPEDTVPPECLVVSQGPAGSILCNRYTASDFFLPLNDPGTGLPTDTWQCNSPVASVDRYWCPSDRESAVNGPPDFVGVYVQLNHDYLTGFIGDSRTLTDNKIVRIEPERD